MRRAGFLPVPQIHHQATIRERNLWIDMFVRTASHAPVVLFAGNHGFKRRNLTRISRSPILLQVSWLLGPH